MVKAAKRRSVSSVSVRSGRETGKTKVVAAVVGAHGARDGRAVERAEGAAGAEGRRATAQDDAQALEFILRTQLCNRRMKIKKFWRAHAASSLKAFTSP